MSDLFTLTIPGVAVAKGRPRATTVGGHARLYTPAKTRAWEERVYLAARDAGIKPVERGVPIALDIWVYLPCPKSAPVKLRRAIEEGCETYPVITRPDADNYAKGVSDALNGVAFTDDAQVAVLHVGKYYSREPRVVVKAWAMEG
jgi:Holliday junction resolvase RusA-like endonuclease